MNFKQEFQSSNLNSSISLSLILKKISILNSIRKILSRSSQVRLGENLRVLVQKLRAPPYISNCSIIIPKNSYNVWVNSFRTLDLDCSLAVEMIDLFLDVDDVLLVPHSQMQLEDAALDHTHCRIQIHYLQFRE